MIQFRLGRIPVRVDASFWFLTVLLAFDRFSAPAFLVEWVAVVFVSILVHELGHALVAMTAGSPASITLYAMGGVTSWNGRAGRAWNIAVSLAGPAAGLALGAAVALTIPEGSDGMLRVLRADLLWVNVGWGVLNLLPILPLDGGHVFQALTGARAAKIVSIVVGVGLALAALAFGFTPAAFLLGWIALSNLQRREPREAGKIRAAAVAAQAGNLEEAEARAREALMTAPDLASRATATRLLAAILTARERPDEALAVLDSMPPGAPPADAERTRALVAKSAALFHAGRFDEAAQLDESSFATTKRGVFAWNAACAHARAGRPETALAWLEKSLDAGFGDEASLAGDDDLAAVRALPGYPALREKFALLAHLRPPISR